MLPIVVVSRSNFFRLNRVVKTHVDLGSVLDTHANGEVMRAENVVRELLGLIANCVGLC